MAIPATISLADRTAAAHSFETLRVLPNGTDRIKDGTSVAEPLMANIRHNYFPAQGKKAAYDRRTVSLLQTKMDADENVFQTGVITSLVVPRVTLFSTNEINDLRAFNAHLVAAYLTDLLLGKS